jgi:hypothetical protein
MNLKKTPHFLLLLGVKWHLGFKTWDFTPLERGFSSYFGYLGGGEVCLS